MNQNVKFKFLDRLRNNDYKQVRGELASVQKNGVECFCASGILCELAYEEGVVRKTEFAPREYAYDGYAGFEPEAVHVWSGIPRHKMTAIIRLNDQKKWSFAEIADWVEENL